MTAPTDEQIDTALAQVAKIKELASGIITTADQLYVALETWRPDEGEVQPPDQNVWPPPPIQVVAGGQVTASNGQQIRDRILRWTQPEAQSSVLYAPVALVTLVNVVLDANGRVQGSFASQKVDATWVKCVGPRAGWGHRLYWRQGNWTHVHILGDAPRGENQYDWHAYGKQVTGNIDVVFDDLLSESGWPSIFGGAETCPINRWMGQGFVKRNGTVILGGLGGGATRTHKQVRAEDVRVHNLEVNHRYERGSYVRGVYTGTVRNNSPEDARLDTSGMRKVASF